jgi:hypothetical protein
MLQYNLDIIENVVKGELVYRDQKLLSYTLKYPQFVGDNFKVFLYKLNVYYKLKIDMYLKFNITKLFQMSIEDYKNSIANGYPVHLYEVVSEYTVTLNQDCVISLFFDKYEYTGGAHGMTIRTSDSWSLEKRKRMTLSDLFPEEFDYKKYITMEIIRQITNEIKEGNNVYFEDYAKLVNENLNINNFYLTPEGVVIYFQQYDIAPYSSGIRTFTIPYSENGAMKPSCK